MRKLILVAFAVLLSAHLAARKVVYDVGDYGISSHNDDNSAQLVELIKSIDSQKKQGDKVVIKFGNDTYRFNAANAQDVNCYISNHDNLPMRKVVFYLRNMQDLTIEGNGARLLFQGSLIPFVLEHCSNISLNNFSVDYVDPQIIQTQIVSNTDQGITFSLSADSRTSAYINHRINDGGRLEFVGQDWTMQPVCGIAFNPDTHHILYNTGDIVFDLSNVTQQDDNTFFAPNWRDNRLAQGTIVAMRNYSRPYPALFFNECSDIKAKGVTVHFAMGMAFIAQRTTDISLDGCAVVPSQGRYYSTQADATHFSQCRGKIVSTNGTYEGMMDDAINVHGVYLRITERRDPNTMVCSFMHYQAYGFAWGDKGDKVQFVNSKTMQPVGTAVIQDIKPLDTPNERGAHAFVITFDSPVPDGADGVENMAWLPEVTFSSNRVSNNRARGCLFSSLGKTVCSDNVFDHTSGAAILLSGDCNGWYESGPTDNVLIRNNRFINALTSQYQFTNAVISVYPVIPDIKNQSEPYHNSITIVNNEFSHFGTPLVYALSVRDIVFNNNRVVRNNDFPELSRQAPLILEHVEHCTARNGSETIEPLILKEGTQLRLYPTW